MTTYWVNNSTGSNAAAGTRAAPWQTLIYALGQIAPKDRIVLVYTGTDYISTTIEIDCEITSDGGGEVLVRNTTAGDDAFRLLACNVILRKITPHDASTSTQSAYRLDQNATLELYSCGSPNNCDRALTMVTDGSRIYAEDTNFGSGTFVTTSSSRGEFKRCASVNYNTLDGLGTTDFSIPTEHMHTYLIGNNKFRAAEEFYSKGTKTVYVDQNIGNNANYKIGADEANPVATIKCALAMANVSTVVVANINAEVFDLASNTLSISSRDITIIGKADGSKNPVSIRSSENPSAGWTLDTGTTYYRTETSDFDVVWDIVSTDGAGNYTAMEKKTSVEEVNASTNTFWWDTGTNRLYVNRGGAAASNIEIPRGTDIINVEGGSLTLKNIKLYGSLQHGLHLRNGAKAYLYACDFVNCEGNGVEANHGCEVYARKCNFQSNGKVGGTGDGIGARHMSYIELEDCNCSYNQDDGASPHDESTLIVKNCNINNNEDRGLVCVTNSRMEVYESNIYSNGQNGSGSNISLENDCTGKFIDVIAYSQGGTDNVRLLSTASADFYGLKDDSGARVTPVNYGSGTVNSYNNDRDHVLISCQNAGILASN